MSDTTWKVARRRKGAPRKLKSHPVSSTSSFHQEELVDVGKLTKRIRDTVSELRCEEFWLQWKKQLLLAASGPGPPDSLDTKDHLEENREDIHCTQLECVCYGLGSFSSSVSARYQLAMLLLLLDAGQIPLQDCFVYDPAFSLSERDILKELGLTVLTENEVVDVNVASPTDNAAWTGDQTTPDWEGKRQANKPTLFYLMHCGKALYNNLLWKNWSAQCLTLVMIIGNSFNGMRERTIERELKRDYRYISEAVGLCEERPLPCPSHLIDIFSDTAVITFPSDSLNRLPLASWTEPPEPQYSHCSDLEIILKQASLMEAPETDDN